MDWKLMKRASKFFAAFIIAVVEISIAVVEISGPTCFLLRSA